MADLIYTNDIIGKESLLAEQFSKMFKKGDKVAVKLHYGEKGNKTSLKPVYAKTIVTALRRLGTAPFLYDSSTMYAGSRRNPKYHLENARSQGFREEDIGCRFVFNDDVVYYKTEHMLTEVCKPLVDADGMVVLTHLKGHICTGFGGSIKNLGMGAVGKKTKADIHGMAKPEYVGGCSSCGLCVKICPFHGIELVEGHPEIGSCAGCDVCVINCPKGALKVSGQPFDVLISEGASAVTKLITKAYYINVMKDITAKCDCLSDPGEPIAPDCGVVMGTDIVAVDKASQDIIKQAAKEDIFLKVNHKSALGHIEHAEKIGMGMQRYNLVEA
jgi:uncharacterized Fe-S center protein